jgi:hypothetical protein
MSSLVVAGDTSGSVTLSAPAVAGSTVLTLPSVSGTILTSASSQVTGPAFSAYSGSNQSVSNSTWTKIQCNTEEFDTNSNYDNATNYRFQPTVAGYYQVTARVDVGTSNITAVVASIYKNGSSFKRGSAYGAGVAVIFIVATASALVYMNGSTDYIEAYGYVSAITPLFYAGQESTYFQAVMVRSA